MNLRRATSKPTTAVRDIGEEDGAAAEAAEARGSGPAPAAVVGGKRKTPHEPSPPELPRKKTHRMNLRHARLDIGEEDPRLRDIEPPGEDLAWKELVDGRGDFVGSGTYWFVPPDTPARQSDVERSLEWLGENESKAIMEAVRSGRIDMTYVSRIFSRNNHFKTPNPNRSKNRKLPFQGEFPLDWAAILKWVVPTTYVGFKGGAKLKEGELMLGEEEGGELPNFPEGLADKQPIRNEIFGKKFYRFEGHSLHYLRVLDWLPKAAVIRAINLCDGNYWNLSAILLVACHQQYERDTLAAKKAPPASDDLVKLAEETIIPVCSELGDVMKDALEEHPTETVRAGWIFWNMYSAEHDDVFGPPMRERRLKQRNDYLRDRKIGEDTKEAMLRKMELLVFVICLIASGSCTDAQCEKALYAIMNGRHDPLSFLWLLKKHSLDTLFDYYAGVYEPYNGIHQAKAQALLCFLIPLYVLDNGEVKIDLLNAFPEIQDKKSRISLNGFGIYRGVGADRWVIRFFGLFFEWDTEYEREKKAKILAGMIPKSLGLNVNDDIGELCQQCNIGGAGREWALAQLEKLAERSEAFNEVYPSFLTILGVNVEEGEESSEEEEEENLIRDNRARSSTQERTRNSESTCAARKARTLERRRERAERQANAPALPIEEESSEEEEVELSAYEQMRAGRVARNAERLRALGLA